jgi:AcrR family transcriptional regulator
VADVDGTRERILDAARACVIGHDLSDVSTRLIAETAQVPVSQLHYHFGGRHGVLVAMFVREEERLLGRQVAMFSDALPLWKQWEQACDFLEDDLRSGYVLVLQRMMAAGWADPEIAVLVRERLLAWYALLSDVARAAADELGGLGPFTAEEVGSLVGNAFLGAEASILLGIPEGSVPNRSALRRVGSMIRAAQAATGQVES